MLPCGAPQGTHLLFDLKLLINCVLSCKLFEIQSNTDVYLNLFGYPATGLIMSIIWECLKKCKYFKNARQCIIR